MIAAHPTRRFWPTLVPARDRMDGAEVMHPVAYQASLGAGRTVVYDRAGPSDDGYQARGSLDAVLRVLGWLGAIGMVVLRRR